MSRRPDALSSARKVALVLRTWWWYAIVRIRVRRRRLPAVVKSLGTPVARARRPVRPVRLGRIVHGSLTIGPVKTRCLFTALVLFRLLREQGDEPVFVVGLPELPEDKDAHAWVELAGADVGPPPGRSGHQELARYA